jgi:asparagine synthase (glutamine-hydrolysing)
VLGHRRLAIIDTSAAGAQPMLDSTGRWAITFNGEIYNYRELRLELQQLGCRFTTSSDTEVLIQAVAQWGEIGLLKLRGMYAFALWDAELRELWLVRDPYGIKPLYVMQHQGALWFASQARALARCAAVTPQPDPAAQVGFYLWGHVPGPFSWWKAIKLLPAGHVQRIRLGQAPSAPRRYAAIQDAYVNHPRDPMSRRELRDVIVDSVCYHLVADVPVGIFLSAGVDSSVIAAMTTELGWRPVTVTLAFKEFAGSPDDEAPVAERVARLLGTDHVTVRLGRDEFDALLAEFLDSMDQPTTDGLNTYLVSYAAAKQGLKVALSGLGGDELFGGYPSFDQVPKLLNWGRFAVTRPMAARLQKFLRMVAPKWLPPKAAGVLSHSDTLAHAYLLRRALHLEDELGELLDERTLNEGLQRLSTTLELEQTIEPLASADLPYHAQIAALESAWYMGNQLLRDTDWASMAHGLEVRLPYVDPIVLDSLGPAIASNSPPGKRDLLACTNRLPAALAERAKTGFTTPVDRWLREATGTPARGLRGWAGYVAEHFAAAASAPRPQSLTTLRQQRLAMPVGGR